MCTGKYSSDAEILDKKYYEFGTSLNSIASKLMELVGTAVAGIIIGFFGVGAAVLIDAVTFFASAGIKMFLKIEETPEKVMAGNGVTQYLQDLKGGLDYVKTKKAVLNLCVMAFLVNAMLVPLNSLQSPLVMEVLGCGSELLSVMGVSLVLGMGLASVVFPYFAKSFSCAVCFVLME